MCLHVMTGLVPKIKNLITFNQESTLVSCKNQLKSKKRCQNCNKDYIEYLY